MNVLSPSISHVAKTRLKPKSRPMDQTPRLGNLPKPLASDTLSGKTKAVCCTRNLVWNPSQWRKCWEPLRTFIHEQNPSLESTTFGDIAPQHPRYDRNPSSELRFSWTLPHNVVYMTRTLLQNDPPTTPEGENQMSNTSLQLQACLSLSCLCCRSFYRPTRFSFFLFSSRFCHV